MAVYRFVLHLNNELVLNWHNSTLNGIVYMNTFNNSQQSSYGMEQIKVLCLYFWSILLNVWNAAVRAKYILKRHLIKLIYVILFNSVLYNLIGNDGNMRKIVKVSLTNYIRIPEFISWKFVLIDKLVWDALYPYLIN